MTNNKLNQELKTLQANIELLEEIKDNYRTHGYDEYSEPMKELERQALEMGLYTGDALEDEINKYLGIKQGVETTIAILQGESNSLKADVQAELLAKLDEVIDNEVMSMGDHYTSTEIADEVLLNIPEEDEKPDSEEVYRVKFHYTEIGTYPIKAKCEEEAQEKLYDLLQEKGLYPLYTTCDITEVFFNVHNVEEVE